MNSSPHSETTRLMHRCRLSLLGVFLAAAAPAFGQMAQVNFNNRLIGAVVAPVYGVNPVAMESRLSGNATTNGGTTDYTGIPLLFGTNYSAALYGGPIGSNPDFFRLLATTKFRTNETASGFFSPVPNASVLDLIGFDQGWVDLQVRVWDNRGNRVPTWGSVLQQPPNLARGTSDVVSIFAVRDGPGQPYPMIGLTSFNLVQAPGFAVSVLTVGNGVAAVTPSKTLYATGEVVQVIATPNRWHAFTQWNDGFSTNPRSVIAESNVVFTAFFAPSQALETLNFSGVSRLAPVGMPATFVDGAFIVQTNVSARGLATVSLSTTFANGTMLFTLDGSEPDISSRIYFGPFIVKRSATLRAIAYNADFTQSVQSDPLEIVILPTLTASTEGGGSVAMEPPAGAYFGNGFAEVTATAAPGWAFLQWLGDATGTNPIVSVSMSRNRCVQAVFGTGFSNTVVGSGSVARSPAMPLYPYGTTVRLGAVPSGENYFALWGNAASGTNNPLHFTITSANPTVTAVFAALQVNQQKALTVLVNGGGSVLRSPMANRFNTGAQVFLTAMPDAGQSFISWSGDFNGIQNPLLVVMLSNQVITANFTKRPRLEVFTCGGTLDSSDVPLQLRGEPGLVHVLRVSTNLVNWSALATVTNVFGTVQWNDTNGGPHRFYQAAEPPPPQ